MMQCLDCKSCRSYTAEENGVRITCLKRNEMVKVARDFYPSFNCEEYEELEPEPEPPKEYKLRVMFKSGCAIEITVGEDDVSEAREQVERVLSGWDDWAELGGFFIRVGEVIAIDRTEIL